MIHGPRVGKMVLWIVAFAAVGALSVSFAFESLPNQPEFPKDNPQTREKIELGKQLFFDPRLSRNGAISCNSCHNVMLGGEDNRPNSVGVNDKRGGRSSPTVWNSAFMSVQFWDGRAASLEDQAKGPLTNPIEMAMPEHDFVVARIQKIPGYVSAFKKVFGTGVTIDNVAKAIASYERTLVTTNSPYDRFVRGDKKALSQSAQRGMKSVQAMGCLACHSGPNFAGPKLPVGQGFFMKFPTIPGSTYEKTYNLTADLGRYEVTKKDSDKNFWRVPTWRNVALTAPYFHNGSVKTLDEAVRVMAKTQLAKDLSEHETSDIVAFLESLTGEFPEQKMPRLPASVGMTLVED